MVSKTRSNLYVNMVRKLNQKFIFYLTVPCSQMKKAFSLPLYTIYTEKYLKILTFIRQIFCFLVNNLFCDSRYPFSLYILVPGDCIMYMWLYIFCLPISKKWWLTHYLLKKWNSMDLLSKVCFSNFLC